MMATRTNSAGLGILPLVIGGVAAAAGGAYVWNKATGLWDLLHLPGSTFGGAVPMPKPPPPPSAAGISTTMNEEANRIAYEGDLAVWRATAFDPYYMGTNAALPPGVGVPASGELPWYVWAGGAALVGLVVLGGRR